MKTPSFKQKEDKLGCSSLSESLFNCGYSSGFNLYYNKKGGGGLSVRKRRMNGIDTDLVWH